jgi:hypothetical protein
VPRGANGEAQGPLAGPVADAAPAAVADAVLPGGAHRAAGHLECPSGSSCLAQRLSTILLPDSGLVLDRRCLADQGSHAELLDRGGLYATLDEHQFRGRAAVEPTLALPAAPG